MALLFLAGTGAGCNDACGEVAEALRRCCAQGPAELRKDCEAKAARIEEDGDSEACERALERGDYGGCAR